MAEFQEVAREYNRMCASFIDNCEDCRINPHEGNNIFACRNNVIKHPEKYEGLIMQWAAEHPEPVYPTWAEWLNSTGLIKHDTGQFCVHMPNQYLYEVKEVDILNEVAYKPIPTDIARKLGLQPKEE